MVKSRTQTTYSIDPELLEAKYNELRKPSLPYGIVINGSPAGILIPNDQLLKAEWLNLPRAEELTTVELTEDVTGILLTQCRMLVLATVPEYVRWKDIEENGEKAGSFIALYDSYRSRLDKKAMDVCCEHALVFLNNKNQPLHKVPIVVRFKNVALWSFKSARSQFYHSLEKVFAQYCGIEYSSKSDKWRSLGVLNIAWRAVKEGEGRNKSLCCKTDIITAPTLNNLPKLFLGQPKRKELIWGFHKSIAGFTEANSEQIPALAASAFPEVQVLSARENGDSKGDKLRQISQVEELNEFDNEFDDS